MLEEVNRNELGVDGLPQDIPEGMSPLAELASLAGDPSLGRGGPQSIPSAAADEFSDEELFPAEPFEEVRRPPLRGRDKSRGKRLVKPEPYT